MIVDEVAQYIKGNFKNNKQTILFINSYLDPLNHFKYLSNLMDILVLVSNHFLLFLILFSFFLINKVIAHCVHDIEVGGLCPARQ